MAEVHTTFPAMRISSEIPKLFLTRMANLLGDEYASFLASYDAAPSVGLRVNTLKIGADSFRALSPFKLAPVPWCPAGFVLTGEMAPGKHPYHAAGLYYLQDPSAMAVAELLDPQPGERVLDLAAAPGGKATHIAAQMQGQGLLVANEIHSKRAWELAGNLERWGARNAVITNESPERLAERFPGFFDRVLVDAPCSGEGMMRKGEAARREWAPELMSGCALRQANILDQAACMVRPGGRLVYSTCTFNPDENEGTLARFLANHPDYTLIEPPSHPGFSPGRPDWITVGAGLAPALPAPAPALPAPALPAPAPALPAPALPAPAPAPAPALPAPALPAPAPALPLVLTRAIRLWPHRAPGEGHFIAILERSADASTTTAVKPWRSAKLPKPVEQAYRAFCAANLSSMPAAEHLALIGSYLYILPADLPDLAGLRFLHAGWWLGILKGDRFEPSHALALGLRLPDARRVLDLPPDAPELAAYLHGETFARPGEDGWALVAVDGFPTGWGKRTGSRLKSHYPKGLRWI